MSIFSSITCPKCNNNEMSLAIAYGFNKIRFCCTDECGYMKVLKISEKEFDVLLRIIERLEKK